MNAVTFVFIIFVIALMIIRFFVKDEKKQVCLDKYNPTLAILVATIALGFQVWDAKKTEASIQSIIQSLHNAVDELYEHGKSFKEIQGSLIEGNKSLNQQLLTTKDILTQIDNIQNDNLERNQTLKRQLTELETSNDTLIAQLNTGRQIARDTGDTLQSMNQGVKTLSELLKETKGQATSLEAQLAANRGILEYTKKHYALDAVEGKNKKRQAISALITEINRNNDTMSQLLKLPQNYLFSGFESLSWDAWTATINVEWVDLTKDKNIRTNLSNYYSTVKEIKNHLKGAMELEHSIGRALKNKNAIINERNEQAKQKAGYAIPLGEQLLKSLRTANAKIAP